MARVDELQRVLFLPVCCSSIGQAPALKWYLDACDHSALNRKCKAYWVKKKKKTSPSNACPTSCKHIVSEKTPVILLLHLRSFPQTSLFAILCASSSLWQTKWKSITLISGLVLFSRLIGML